MDALQNLPGLGEIISGTDSDGNLINENFLGGTRVFEHYEDYGDTSSPVARRDGQTIVAVALRNTSGGLLLPKRLGRLEDAAIAEGVTNSTRDNMFKNVEGYGAALYHRYCVLIDPWIVSTGVPDNDIFWGIVCGPAPGMSPQDAGDANGDAATGDLAVCSADTQGRVTIPIALGTGTGDSHQEAIDIATAILGTYMQACADASVDTDVWVRWRMPWF